MTQPAQNAAPQGVAAVMSGVVDTLATVPPPAPIMVGTNGTPGGYKFEPDQVQAVIAKWQELLDGVIEDLRYANQVANVTPPGQEFASSDFVDQGAGPSGQTLLNQHERMKTYIENYIRALQQASGQIQQTEDDARQTAAQQGQGIV